MGMYCGKIKLFGLDGRGLRMLQIGIQTSDVIKDECPLEGFAALRRAGFSCADFGLNEYNRIDHFFSQSVQELETFFRPHRLGAEREQVRINQMHMPHPLYDPFGNNELNTYLKEDVAYKSMAVCAFFKCPFMVVHGHKLTRVLGSEEEEWERTEALLDFLVPVAKEMGITICLENLYDSVGGRLIEGPCCDAGKMAARIDKMNEKYQAEVLGFCLDTGHANLTGINLEKFIVAMGHRIKVLHIHDNDGVEDLHWLPFCPIGNREGMASVDWNGFLNGLREIKYDRVLNFETAPVIRIFPDRMQDAVLGFIAQVGKYFIGELGI